MTKRWFHYFRLDYEVLCRLETLEDKLDLIIQNQELMIMALQADVQKLVDTVAANASLAASAEAAQVIQAKQISDLQAQLAAIQPGAPVDAEDLAAIQGAVTTLAQTNAALTPAIPAGTTT